MTKYDNNFTDILRERLSIIDIVGRRVPLKKKGQNYWACCPFHNEKTPSFSVNEEKGFYHCFGCGEHGDIISFVMKSENVDFRTAIRELADMAGLKIPDYKPKTSEQIKKEDAYFSILEKATQLYQKKLYEPDGKFALDYIKKREFTDKMIKKYRLGYAPKANIIANKFINTRQDVLLGTGLCKNGEFGLYDFFHDKLMFPIFNSKGRIIAFSGRSLDGSEPKYINTADTELFHKRKTIFGLNFAHEAIHRNNKSIVVEGQIDVIQMQSNGFPETVAPLGTALTEDHIAILCKSNRNIIFCFDGDDAGQKAALRACSLVMPFIRDNSDIKFASVIGGKDPDEILRTGGTDAMKKIIFNAVSLVDFLWNTVNKNYLINTPGGRIQAEKFLNNELKKISDISLRKEYEQEYDSRKFNQWHKWKKDKSSIENIELPKIDDLTENTIIFITNNFPEIAEKHMDFLNSLNIPFDKKVPKINLDEKAAEKFIISVKIQKYLKKLNEDKKKLVVALLSGDRTAKKKLKKLNEEITKVQNDLDDLISI